jgi:hypothetical protein
MTFVKVRIEVLSNLYIRDTQGNLKMCPLSVVALYIQVKIIYTSLMGKEK